VTFSEALRAEIQFWEEMLDDFGPDSSTEAIEKIRQAKSLAEQKLSLLSRKCPQTVN